MIQPAASPPAERFGRHGTWWAGLALLLALLVMAGFWQSLRVWSYGLVRQAEIWHTEWRLSHWQTLDNAHFRLYYPLGQSQEAHLVLSEASRALVQEERNLAVRPEAPLVVVLYASQAAMNRAVGIAPGVNNIGYDDNGVMDILSPSAWLGTSKAAFQEFAVQGPVDHELGHALLNLKADGNYPNWFNEGVAQYEDYHATGYQWITPHNRLTGAVYSMPELNNRFYQLSNQALAYRQGLSLVEYLETLKGASGFHQFLGHLAKGQSFDFALSSTYHIASAEVLWQHWHHWVNPSAS